MKLGDRRFWHSLRTTVRAVVRANPAWTKERQRARGQLKQSGPLWLGRLLFSVVALGMFTTHDDPHTLLSGGGAWWLIAVVLLKTSELMAASIAGPGFAHALVYPMPHEPQWRVVRRKLVTGAAWVAAEFGAALVLATELRDDFRVWLLAVLFGITQASVLVLLAIVAHRILPVRLVRRLTNASVAIGASLFLTVFAAVRVSFLREHIFERAASALELFTPAGLIARFFLNAAADPSSRTTLAALGLAIITVALAAMALQLLRGRMLAAFRAQEEIFCRDGLVGLETANRANASTKAPNGGDAETAAEESRVAKRVSSETINHVASRLRSALAQPPGPRRRGNSRWDRAVERFSDRESIAAAEHLWPKWPRLGRWWFVCLAAVVLAPSIGAAFSHRGSDMRAFAAFVASVVVVVGAVPLGTRKWRLRTSALIGSRVAPWLAFYPVGHSAISRAVFRFEVLRVLASWPLIVMLAVYSWDETGVAIERRASLAIVAMAVTLAIQPLRVSNAFSPLDGGGTRLRHQAFGVAFGFLFVAAFIAACALAARVGIAGAFAGAVLINAAAFSVWYAYREAHHRCWWDLVSARGN